MCQALGKSWVLRRNYWVRKHKQGQISGLWLSWPLICLLFVLCSCVLQHSSLYSQVVCIELCSGTSGPHPVCWSQAGVIFLQKFVSFPAVIGSLQMQMQKTPQNKTQNWFFSLPDNNGAFRASIVIEQFFKKMAAQNKQQHQNECMYFTVVHNGLFVQLLNVFLSPSDSWHSPLPRPDRHCSPLQRWGFMVAAFSDGHLISPLLKRVT